MKEEVWGDPKKTWGEKKPPPQITLHDFEKLVDEAFDERQKMEDYQAEVKKHREVLDKKNKEIMIYLESCGKKGYDHGRGRLTVSEYLSVQVPRDPESRKKFFGFLKTKGDFDNLITVNSQTLQSYYKAEFETAVKAGAKSFDMPGIGAPTYYTRLKYRRK